jgi:alpha-N-arabinofuranosidase
MLNPLTNALVYHEFFRHSDRVGLAVATGGLRTLATDSRGDAIGLRMEGLVMKLLHDHFAAALPVAVTGGSPQVPTKGVVGIDTSARPSGSPTWPLDVFAAVSADRGKMAISVVNPTETPRECDLNLAGAQASGPARVHQLTAPAGATPAESSLPQAPRRITEPPASLTVYAFDLR